MLIGAGGALALAAAIGLMLYGGGKVGQPPPPPTAELQLAEEPPFFPDGQLDCSEWRRKDPEAARALQAVQCSFAVRLLKELSTTTSGNLVISPHSLITALGAVMLGAQGETLAEWRETIRFPGDEAALGRALARADAPFLCADQDGGTRGMRYQRASSLWSATELVPKFGEAARSFYGANVKQVSFRTETDRAASASLINTWFEGRTQGQITDLVRAEDFSLDTGFVLTDALALSAPWTVAPDARTGTFRDAHGTLRKDVPSLRFERHFEVWVGASYQAVNLMLSGPEEIAALFVLPRDETAPTPPTEALRAACTAPEADKRPFKYVQATVPKFVVAGKQDVTPALRAIGLQRAFDRTTAQFRFSRAPKQWLESAKHATRAEVDEEGFSGAAASAIRESETAARTPIKIVFDHPFGFFVFGRHTGQIFFAGWISELASI